MIHFTNAKTEVMVRVQSNDINRVPKNFLNKQ